MESFSEYSIMDVIVPTTLYMWNLSALCVERAHSFLLLHSIPFYDYTMVYLFILLLMDVWIVSRFWLLWIMLPWHSWVYVYISIAYIPKSGIPGPQGRYQFSICSYHEAVFQNVSATSLSPAMCEISNCFVFLPILGTFCLFHPCHSGGCVVI